MKNLVRRYWILFLLCFLISLSVPLLPGTGQGVVRPDERLDRAAFAEKHIDRLQQTAKQLHALALEPLPQNLSDDAKKEAMKYTRWLIAASRRLGDLASRWQDDLKNKGMVQSVVLVQSQMEEMNRSYLKKYSALRGELLHELSQHVKVSHSMSSNYDSAHGSIDSLR
jgi:hypothetical protein